MNKLRLVTLLRAIALALVAVVLLVVVPANAGTTITVTTVVDELNTDGDCSLREAIRAANLDTPVSGCPAGNGADTIVLAAGQTYTLSIPNPSPPTNEDAAVTGDLDITADLTIIGNNATIKGNGTTYNDRIFEIRNNAKVTISKVTIRDGQLPTGDDRGGGGINNQAGTLTLIDSTVTQNDAVPQIGGGISNPSLTMTIINSVISNNTTRSFGGGISNGGTMFIIGSTVSGNSSTDPATGGGGIANGGTLTLINTTVSGNQTKAKGGGILSEKNLTIIGSTIDNNTADSNLNNGPEDKGGGGIYNSSAMTITFSTVSRNDANDAGGIVNDGGTATIRNSSIISNTAGSAGGLRNHNDGTLSLVNSTVSGNTANGGAGGIANNFASGTVAGTILNLSNVTIANNTADNDNAGGGQGGGIHNVATVNFKNTLIGNNVDKGSADGSEPDCHGTLNSQGFNFIENNNGCSLTGVGGVLTGSDPMLGPLRNNGGPTLTHGLLINPFAGTSSPAIDAGNSAGCTDHNNVPLPADQRGGARSGAGHRCDIGAFEFGACLIAGDVDDDRDTDTTDLSLVGSDWHASPAAYDFTSDLSENGFITTQDIQLAAATFGQSCP